MAVKQHASDTIKGGAENAQNLPTQKASEKEGAWLQKENEDRRRQKCSQEKTRERQKETDLLIGKLACPIKTADVSNIAQRLRGHPPFSRAFGPRRFFSTKTKPKHINITETVV